jgi:nitrogen fixation protein FixH
MTVSRSGRYIPWIFVGSMTLVVCVNAGMVMAAFSTYSGLTHADAYGRGLAYNRVLDRLDQQERLGWRVEAAWAAAGGNDPDRLRLVVRDRMDNPLVGARILGVLVRPVERADVIALEFSEGSSGVYATDLSLPQRGQWDLRLLIEYAGDRVETTRRVFAR